MKVEDNLFSVLLSSALCYCASVAATALASAVCPQIEVTETVKHINPKLCVKGYLSTMTSDHSFWFGKC